MITADFDTFRSRFHESQALGFSLDLSRLPWDAAFEERMRAPMAAAIASMEQLEGGAIANPDENRMVGHYWLRAPERAPTAEIAGQIRTALAQVERFVRAVHAGEVFPATGGKFENLLVVGIGGSALGPQFVAAALGDHADRMRPYFLDNTDPDGMDRVLGALGPALARTLTLVISKSGGTKETRNGMLEAEAAYRRAGLSFARHAVAVTGEGSALDKHAAEQGFLARFPMWDWVGGRTSVLSAVGLLPAALQGVQIDGLLQGAREMDALTRERETWRNPAALLALAWYAAGDGRGTRDMVLLPYKDRLELFSRYLQQLVMESIGKELDLDGQTVHQGIAVYGNKGSTDQHAYVQQLRDGLPNAFVTFIEVLRERAPGAATMEVEPGLTSGDYLAGFLHGTREALSQSGRPSITLTIETVDARRVGQLIALYERAVGLYAALVNINAYHQPGVEAGKKAAGVVLALQQQVVAALQSAGGARTAAELASSLGAEPEAVLHILRRLAANPGRGVAMQRGASETLFEARFAAQG